MLKMHLKKLCSHVMIVTIFLFLKQWLIKEIIHVIYDGLDDLTARGGNWGCNVSLGLAGALWSTAFGMVTAGAGFVVAVGWCVLQTWLCSSRVVSRPPTEIQIDTIEFKPMERDDDSIARDTIGKLLPLR